MNNVTWQQVSLAAVLFAGTIAAYKFLGPEAGVAAAAVSNAVSFMMGRTVTASEPKDGAQ
jgi:hypothetical protein